MATDGHGSRHSHCLHRAEAYATALYYSECALRGISPDGAAVAEVHARSRQSRWWLKGNDPNHPSHEVHEAVQVNANVGGVLRHDHTSNETVPSSEASGISDAHTDVEDSSRVVDAQDEDDDHIDADETNSPILARDDDLGSSFGTLSNFIDSSNTQRDVNGGLPVMGISQPPSFLTPTLPLQRTSNHTSQETKQDVGSLEDMLKSYDTYPNELLARESPSSVAALVTSESDADSVYSSGKSCDTSVFYPRPRPGFQGLKSKAVGSGRSRKRKHVDFGAPLDQSYLEAQIACAKSELMSRLEEEGTGLAFQNALTRLEKYTKMNSTTGKKRRLSSSPDKLETTDIDGTWLTFSSPDYPSSLGKNANGENLFTLGRMSFDMFQPSNLVCSIQKQYNTIHSVEPKDLPHYVPKSLRKEVENECTEEGSGRLKTYNIIASFTIESQNGTEGLEVTASEEPKKLRGILTNYGYALPDPTNPDRKSIWFSGGTIEPADDDSMDEWRKIFGSKSLALSSHGDVVKDESKTEADKARILASRILLGAVPEPMDDDGIVGFHLNKPIGGHGSAFVDVVYMDDELRIMRGHSGSIYVFKRVV